MYNSDDKNHDLKIKKDINNIYLKMKVNNDIWVINRITSLIRRRQYSIENFTVYFDNKDNAYLIIQIHNEKCNKIQLINQISKIYDVVDISEINISEEKYYVYSDNKDILNKLNITPVKINEEINTRSNSKQYIWLYIVDIIDISIKENFKKELDKLELYYEWQM